MNNTKVSSYWIDSIEAALDAAGIVATQKQIEQIAGDVETSHELYGQAHGYECIPNPIQEENTKLKRQLEQEQRKVVCPECKGKGRIYSQGPYHCSDSQCDKCRGEGYVIP